ncbi:rRNA maturation RNase YbeY [Acetobacter sacchari]|uniref:Endoribonuclease YbeY n=1 Tax=Acetobacter sacchari TaxID=2661687 RepID=A0ABS3LTX6_9PROT|nr:rRNA maturation RNase YbeY [Acetobacter sacchari]MBO1359354.1 rRNA maturation RNase YbeY [Acetobacter sacchari]
MEPRSSDSRVLDDAADNGPPLAGDRSLGAPDLSGWFSAQAEGEFEIIIEDARWRGCASNIERTIRRAVSAVARRSAALGEGSSPCPDTIVLSSDRVVKRLNARHRGRNKPTNVLTFEVSGGYAGGDIVLAFETVRREAHAAGRSPLQHLAHLVVHGVLHLDGHDHHLAGEARRMEMEEARILAGLGVPNPWKPRV